MGKIIKNIAIGILKFFGYTLEFILFIAIISIFLIRSPWIQTYVAHLVASYYSHELGTEVEVESVKIYGLDYAEITGLQIKDLKGDTLIYSPKFTGSLEMLSMRSEFAILKAINSDNARVKLQKYKGDTVTNIQFLIDYFSTEDTTESEFKIKINEINLSNLHFSFDNWNIDPIPYGMDYNHLDLKNVNGKVSSLRNRNGVTTFSLDSVSLKDKSGFVLNDLHCHFLASDKKIKFEDLGILTPHSNMDIKGLSFNYQDYGDLSDFVNAVVMKGHINDSRLNLQDLSYFAPVFEKFTNNIKVEGILDGTVSNFNIKDLYLGLSAVTYYSGEVDIKGLPYADQALFYLDINSLQTSADDLRKFDYEAMGFEDGLEIPNQLDRLGVVKLAGTIDGFLDEFYTNLTIESNAGNASANLQAGLDSVYTLNYTGDINTQDVALGDLIGDKGIGNLTSEFSLKGHGVSLDQLETIVFGHLHNFNLYGYNYEQIDLQGDIFHKKFKGALEVSDNNLDFKFNGTVDMNSRTPRYNFVADISKANLHELHFVDRPTSSFKGIVEVRNSTGSTLDNFKGTIVIDGAEYYENGITYEFDKLELSSSQDSAYREIHINSQFADIDMTGDYHLATLDESLYSLANKIFPSLFRYEPDEEIQNEKFDLTIMIKDLSALTAIFYPNLEVAPYSEIGIQYESDFELLELSARSDYINYADMRFVNFVLDTTQKFVIFDPLYTLDIHVDSAIISDGVHFENLDILSDMYNDDLHTKISWFNKDSTYWGSIESDIDMRSPSNMMFALHPSDIYHDKLGLWSIENDAIIKIDSTTLKIDKLLATNGHQSIKMLGQISENPDRKLKVYVGQFDMSNLDAFMTDSSTHMRGKMDATVYLTDVYNNFIYNAYCQIKHLGINQYDIGDLVTQADWNPLKERIQITGDIYARPNEPIFKIDSGFYYVKKEKDNLYFDINFLETDLAFANVFMPDGFSNLQGLLKGHMYVEGSTSNPKLKGKLNLHDAGLKIDMLNTSYYASGTVEIDTNIIYADYLPIKDKLGAKGFLNGSFYHQNFEKYNYDFYASFAEPFLVMNTTYDLNPYYYGNAFATGDVSISYDDINELDITVNAKSEKGTDITLPLYGSEDVELQDFITFISNDSTKKDDEYDVDLEGIEMTLSMDITEDAKIQLVFDDIVGDAMQGIGEGHIDMYIDQFYDFYMFGSYEVTQGSYLFTLKDLLNKKFEVEKGGTINWYGDPYEADIDLTAIYKLKTSLFDIMPENQRESYRQKTDVETHMHLTDNLFNPILNFDIELPRSDENAKTILSNMVSTEAEMNKQVFSLLLLNKFLPSEYNTTGSSSGGTAAIGSTTSEMLSNQLSNMLSKFSDDFDIGFNYQPGDEVTSQEVALALSTQLFDDRLTITTNLGVSHQNAGDNSNSLIGDVDVEYKMNEEGNTRIHGFNRSNEYDITQQEATYTQGVGVFYQESFSTFPELMCKLKNLFIREEKECVECDSNCNQYLTEEEKKACKEEKKAAADKCREERRKKEKELKNKTTSDGNQ